jgi:AcrR family transcriptional regulator
MKCFVRQAVHPRVSPSNKSNSSVDFRGAPGYLRKMPAIGHTAPRRPRRSDFQRTRERIVTAARRLMAERGPESLTVSAVAHAAGINRTTAYQHFRTRDELVRAVTEELIAEVGAYVATRRPIVEHIDAIAAYFLEHPELARLAIYWLLSEGPIPRASTELFLQETRRIIEDGGAQDDADAEMLGHLLMGVAVLWPLHARIEFDNAGARHAATARLAREFKRLLLYGLLRPEQWPNLVSELAREPASAARRPRRTP